MGSTPLWRGVWSNRARRLALMDCCVACAAMTKPLGWLHARAFSVVMTPGLMSMSVWCAGKTAPARPARSKSKALKQSVPAWKICALTRCESVRVRVRVLHICAMVPMLNTRVAYGRQWLTLGPLPRLQLLHCGRCC